MLTPVTTSNSGRVPVSDQPARKPLDHDCYDAWNTLLDAKLANSGQWLHYTVKNGKGDSTLVIRQTGSDQQFTIGLVANVRQPVVVMNNLRNLPQKGTYSWDPGAFFGIYRPDTLWFGTKR